jgi:predicted aldo/keto reductase-like oxidoreductase
MSTLDQTTENIKIFDNIKPLEADALRKIDNARREIFKIKTVPCTGCGYCAKCPQNIDIPGIMLQYNEYKLYNNAFGFKQSYARFGGKTAKACTKCGTCLPLCPQGIEIPARLADIDREEAAVVL